MPARPAVTSYKQIDLWDSKTIRERFRKLDPDQQYVADLYVKYARTLKLAQKGFCTFIFTFNGAWWEGGAEGL